MNSKEALTLLIPKDIQTHIDFRNKYGSSIKGFICKDLDRLEELEEQVAALDNSVNNLALDLDISREENSKLKKTIELLKDRVKMLETYHEPKSRYYYLYVGGRIVLLSREEYLLLKEVLENDK